MDRREFIGGAAALTGSLAMAKPALAQSAELSFFYPVAVGGPITKLIDAYAAGFEKDNPTIKVKPIYAGTYQETIVKALTAHKSGNPPTTSVLLSTDMFTLIDEDAIVPIEGWSRPVSGSSTVLAMILMHEIIARTAAELSKRGIELPTFASPTIAGVTLHDTDVVYGVYREQILKAQQKHLATYQATMRDG